MSVSVLSQAVARLEAGESLDPESCRAAIAAMLDSVAGDAETAAFLTALHRKGETAGELAGAVAAIRERMIAFHPGGTGQSLLDTCGTGGDGANTFNISTATAIVLAACGARVVKHGNRAASGRSGSSEVLERLGIGVELEPAVLHRCLEELGIAFLYAPAFHPGLRRVSAVRRALPFRSIFNLVGPLCNPASPSHQLVGIPDPRQARLMAEVLSRFETTRRAVVVSGGDGLDEVTLDGSTHGFVVEAGTIRDLMWTRNDFQLPRVRAVALRVSGPEESASLLRELLAAQRGPVRDIVLANAAAALWTLDPQPLPLLVERAASAIDSHAAARLVARWSELTRPVT